MAYPKRSSRRHYTRRRPMRSRRATGAWGVTSRPYAAGSAGSTRYVRATPGRQFPLMVRKAAPSTEVHFVDHNINPILLLSQGNGWQITHLNGAGQGTALYEREGAQTQNLRLQIRATLTNRSPIDVVSYMGFVIVYDAQGNQSTPTGLEIMALNHRQSFVNPYHRNRFQILYQTTLMVTGNAVTPNDATASTGKDIDLNIDLGKRMTAYAQGTGGGPSDIISGAIYLMTIGDSGSAVSQLDFGFHSRLQFVP